MLHTERRRFESSREYQSEYSVVATHRVWGAVAGGSSPSTLTNALEAQQEVHVLGKDEVESSRLSDGSIAGVSASARRAS